MDIYEYILSTIVGFIVGLFFFGTLWLTVRRLPTARRPVFLAVGSFFGRVVITVFCFYLVITAWSWQGLLVCMLGFILARVMVVGNRKVEIGKIRRENADNT